MLPAHPSRRKHHALSNLKLSAVRASFALKGRLAPQHAVLKAARLFATPFASSRKRARTALPDPAMRQGELQVNREIIATYVGGDAAAQPYVLLAHDWSSFGLHFSALGATAACAGLGRGQLRPAGTWPQYRAAVHSA